MRKNIEELSLAPATRGIFEELPRRLYGSRYLGEEAPDGLPFFVVRGNDGAVLSRAAVWTRRPRRRSSWQPKIMSAPADTSAS